MKAHALGDNNLSNNQMNVSVNIISDYDLSVMFVRIDNVSNFDSYIDDSVDYMQKIFPVKDNGIEMKIYPTYINSTTFLNERGFNLPITDKENSSNARYEFVRYLDRLGKSSKVDKVVGVAPVGFISNVLNGNGIGYTYSYLSTGVLVESGYRDVVAHEISHTRASILCDEYSNSTWNLQNSNRLLFGFIGSGCPNGDRNNDNMLDVECLGPGCPTSTIGRLVGQPNISEIDYYNFMGNLVYPYVWISNDSYNAIINGFQKGFLGKTLQKIMMYTGRYFKNGSVSIDTSYIIEEAYAISDEEVIPGNVSINLTNDNNEIIYSINFTPIFSINGKNISDSDTNISYFSFSLPYNETLHSVQFIDNNNIINQKNVTPNTPNLNITYPLGNETHLQDKFNITWTSSDADNDAVYHAILISSNNGTDYTTIDIDNNNTYFEIDPSDFEYSEEYVVKILATDGVNTNSSVSNVFTMGTVDLAVVSLQEIYSNGPYKIFEVIIENNQSTALNNISWSFDLGDGTIISSFINIDLEAGKSIFVYVEYNYATNNSYSVTATTKFKDFTDSLSLGAESDLIITNLTELYSSNKDKLWEFVIKNNGSDTINNINWSLDTQETTTYANYLTNLNASEDIMVFFDYTFSGTGDFIINATAFDDSSSYSKTINSSVKLLEVADFSALSISGQRAVFEFILVNHLNVNLTNITWTIDFGDNSSLNSTQTIALLPDNNIFVYVDYTYPSSGSYTVNATAYNNTIQDSDVIEVNI